MDYASSGSGFSNGIKTVSVNSSRGMNFVGTSAVGGTTFANIKKLDNSTDIPELDYEDKPVERITFGEAFIQNWKETVSWKFGLETGAYVSLKTFFSEAYKEAIGQTLGGKLTGAVMMAFYTKMFANSFGYVAQGCEDDTKLTTSVLLGGSLKDFIKTLATQTATKSLSGIVYENTLLRASLKALPNADKTAVKQVMKAQMKGVEEAFGQASKNGLRLGKKGFNTFNTVFKAGIAKDALNMSFGTGIDYVASVVTTGISALITGDLKTGSFAEFAASTKLGSNLLTSAYKTVFGIAFERMFTFAGPVGMKFGKTLGTIVGASIGNFWVKAFSNEDGTINEGWCAVAGVATVAGAVGGIWAGAAIAAACSATVPVAGWIVGGCIVAGALIATGVTYLVYWFSGW